MKICMEVIAGEENHSGTVEGEDKFSSELKWEKGVFQKESGL